MRVGVTMSVASRASWRDWGVGSAECKSEDDEVDDCAGRRETQLTRPVAKDRGEDEVHVP